MKYELNMTVKTKKPHVCGFDLWTVIRVGADIKIKCQHCERIVMISKVKLDKMVKENA